MQMEKWTIDKNKCIYCAGCVSICPTMALTNLETEIVCDLEKCTRCGICEKGCPLKAITVEKE